MRHRPATSALLLALGFGLAATRPLAGQRRPAEPPRPKLEGISADTNSAPHYYYRGVALLQKRPRDAADAFYWAARLDPTWAEPLYARRVAMHLQLSPANLYEYLIDGPRVVNAKEVRAADSLHYEALLRNPFLYERLDELMVDRVVGHVRDLVARSGSMADPLAVTWGSDGDPWEQARRAYGRGDFPKALAAYATIAKRKKDAYYVHGRRGRVFFLLTQFDSSASELRLVLDEMRKRDEKKLVYYYESKAFLEYEIGQIDVARGDLNAARESYGRALTEDLSFYMAHAALGDLALVQGDTATAAQEYDLAVQLRPTDPALRERYGTVLLAARRVLEALTQFQKAIELEPHYAQPYFAVGVIYHNSGFEDETRTHLTEFVRRAARSDEKVPVATQLLATLAATPPGSPAASSSP